MVSVIMYCSCTRTHTHTHYCTYTIRTCSLPTDVQGDAIPLILGGGDVLMAAETGSGKTGVGINCRNSRISNYYAVSRVLAVVLYTQFIYRLNPTLY